MHGISLLRLTLANKGTAFSPDERRVVVASEMQSTSRP